MLYAWARNAPQLVLPPDVGFMVGRHSGVQYLVLQVSILHIYLDIYTTYLHCISTLHIYLDMYQDIYTAYLPRYVPCIST